MLGKHASSMASGAVPGLDAACGAHPGLKLWLGKGSMGGVAARAAAARAQPMKNGGAAVHGCARVCVWVCERGSGTCGGMRCTIC